MSLMHSPWVNDCLNQVFYKDRKKKYILDLACGKGRNSILSSKFNALVFAADKNSKYLKSFSKKNIVKVVTDIEDLDNWTFANNKFDVILVVNFLNRDIFANILKTLKKNGHLIYETFALKNRLYGKPRNINYLLKKQELLKLTKGLKLISFEEVDVNNEDRKYSKQRVFCKSV